MRKLLLALLISTPALAGDPAYWGHLCDDGKCDKEEVHQWMPTVMQPGWEQRTDQGHSCCGEADAYAVDSLGEEGNFIRVRIRDGQGRVPDGTIVMVPKDKLQWHYGNPTGKFVLFMGTASNVYCLIPDGGV